MTAIELDAVTKRYETGGEIIEALKAVEFTAEPGEMVAVVGPSGSGKSTLLNIVGLLDAPDDGRVLLDGRDVTDESERVLTRLRRRSIGFIFQHFYLLPTLSAVENVQVPTLYTRGNRAATRDRAGELLDRVGLGDRLTHRPGQLSGGQRQRVAIARALVNEPQVLLADEPTGNLDQDTGRTILDEFTRFADEEDVAVIAVTHDEMLAEYADRIVELVDGVIEP